ncbi:esterase/lipase family protein [Lysobacter sp. A286]
MQDPRDPALAEGMEHLKHPRSPSRRNWSRWLIVAVIPLLAGACSTLRVHDNAALRSRMSLDGLALAGHLSNTTNEVVSMLDLRTTCSRASNECASRIIDATGTIREGTRLIAASDVLYQAAKHGPQDTRVAHWRACAHHTHRYLHAPMLPGRQGPITARTQLALRLHNACTAGLALNAIAVRGPEGFEWDVEAAHFPRPAVTNVVLANQVKVRGLRTRHVEDGIGVAAIASGRTDAAIGSFPPQPFALAINILFEPLASGGERLVARDASRAGSIDTAFGPITLSRDMSAAYARAAVGFENELGYLSALFAAETGRDDSQIRLLAPVDPNKTPVILVHGFASSPMTWANMVNELLGDPDISEHYQFWMARYSTGMPVLVNRQELAGTLQDFRSRASAASGGYRHAVLVGHSMGGVISRLLLTDPGTALWNAAFTADPDTFDPGEAVDRARELFVFQPIQGVDELVMIAAPHGGSTRAEGLVARLVQRFIRLPVDTMDYLVQLAVEHPESVQPSVLDNYRQGGPTSLGTLSPDQPVIHAARALPVIDGVAIHSIVGIQDPARPEKGDGVVSLESATWTAGSVDHVTAGHDLQTEPATISILKRILLKRINTAPL